MDNLSNPQIFGPGTWNIIHTAGIRATTEQNKKFFRDLMVLVFETFRCMKCKKHLEEFMKFHPFRNYEKIYDSKRREIGYFKWSWECHNNVNAILGKPILELETAYDMWSSITPCENCGDGIHESNYSEVQKLKTTAINIEEYKTSSLYPLVQIIPVTVKNRDS